MISKKFVISTTMIFALFLFGFSLNFFWACASSRIILISNKSDSTLNNVRIYYDGERHNRYYKKKIKPREREILFGKDTIFFSMGENVNIALDNQAGKKEKYVLDRNKNHLVVCEDGSVKKENDISFLFALYKYYFPSNVGFEDVSRDPSYEKFFPRGRRKSSEDCKQIVEIANRRQLNFPFNINRRLLLEGSTYDVGLKIKELNDSGCIDNEKGKEIIQNIIFENW